MGDPLHFDANAGAYERGRPAYPGALWSRLRELGALRPGIRALDLGAGTGLATGPLLAAGLAVTAIEPGPRLAARLRVSFPAATVHATRAEDAVLAANSFELAVAATSIHWMTLDVVLPKLHDALTEDGRFVVWRTAFGDPSVSTPFRRRIGAIVDARGERAARSGPGEDETARWAEALSAAGLFVPEHIETIRWSIELDEQHVRDLFTSFSDWLPREAEAAALAVRDAGGTVTEHYLTPLIALRRAG